MTHSPVSNEGNQEKPRSSHCKLKYSPTANPDRVDKTINTYKPLIQCSNCRLKTKVRNFRKKISNNRDKSKYLKVKIYENPSLNDSDNYNFINQQSKDTTTEREITNIHFNPEGLEREHKNNGSCQIIYQNIKADSFTYLKHEDIFKEEEKLIKEVQLQEIAINYNFQVDEGVATSNEKTVNVQATDCIKESEDGRDIPKPRPIFKNIAVEKGNDPYVCHKKIGQIASVLAVTSKATYTTFENYLKRSHEETQIFDPNFNNDTTRPRSGIIINNFCKECLTNEIVKSPTYKSHVNELIKQQIEMTCCKYFCSNQRLSNEFNVLTTKGIQVVKSIQDKCLSAVNILVAKKSESVGVDSPSILTHRQSTPFPQDTDSIHLIVKYSKVKNNSDSNSFSIETDSTSSGSITKLPMSKIPYHVDMKPTKKTKLNKCDRNEETVDLDCFDTLSIGEVIRLGMGNFRNRVHFGRDKLLNFGNEGGNSVIEKDAGTITVAKLDQSCENEATEALLNEDKQFGLKRKRSASSGTSDKFWENEIGDKFPNFCHKTTTNDCIKRINEHQSNETTNLLFERKNPNVTHKSTLAVPRKLRFQKNQNVVIFSQNSSCEIMLDTTKNMPEESTNSYTLLTDKKALLNRESGSHQTNHKEKLLQDSNKRPDNKKKSYLEEYMKSRCLSDLSNNNNKYMTTKDALGTEGKPGTIKLVHDYVNKENNKSHTNKYIIEDKEARIRSVNKRFNENMAENCDSDDDVSYINKLKTSLDHMKVRKKRKRSGRKSTRHLNRDKLTDSSPSGISLQRTIRHGKKKRRELCTDRKLSNRSLNALASLSSSTSIHLSKRRRSKRRMPRGSSHYSCRSTHSYNNVSTKTDNTNSSSITTIERISKRVRQSRKARRGRRKYRKNRENEIKYYYTRNEKYNPSLKTQSVESLRNDSQNQNNRKIKIIRHTNFPDELEVFTLWSTLSKNETIRTLSKDCLPSGSSSPSKPLLVITAVSNNINAKEIEEKANSDSSENLFYFYCSKDDIEKVSQNVGGEISVSIINGETDMYHQVKDLETFAILTSSLYDQKEKPQRNTTITRSKSNGSPIESTSTNTHENIFGKIIKCCKNQLVKNNPVKMEFNGDDKNRKIRKQNNKKEDTKQSFQENSPTKKYFKNFWKDNTEGTKLKAKGDIQEKEPTKRSITKYYNSTSMVKHIKVNANDSIFRQTISDNDSMSDYHTTLSTIENVSPISSMLTKHCKSKTTSFSNTEKGIEVKNQETLVPISTSFGTTAFSLEKYFKPSIVKGEKEYGENRISHKHKEIKSDPQCSLEPDKMESTVKDKISKLLTKYTKVTTYVAHLKPSSCDDPTSEYKISCLIHSDSDEDQDFEQNKSIDNKSETASKQQDFKNAVKLKLKMGKITEKPEQENSTDLDEQLQLPDEHQKESNKGKKKADLDEEEDRPKSKVNGPNSGNTEESENKSKSSSDSNVEPPLVNKHHKRNSKDSTTTKGSKDVKSNKGSLGQRKSIEEPDDNSNNSVESQTTPVYKNQTKSSKPRKQSKEVEEPRPEMSSSSGKRSAENEYESDSESEQNQKSELPDRNPKQNSKPQNESDDETSPKVSKKRKTETNSTQNSGPKRRTLLSSDKVFKNCGKLYVKSEKTSTKGDKDRPQVNPLGYEKSTEKDKTTQSPSVSDEEIKTTTSTDSVQTNKLPKSKKDRIHNKSGEQAIRESSSESADEQEISERRHKRMSTISGATQISEVNSMSQKGSLEDHEVRDSFESSHGPLSSEEEPKDDNKTKSKLVERRQSFDSQTGDAANGNESCEGMRSSRKNARRRIQTVESNEELNLTLETPQFKNSYSTKKSAKGHNFEPQMNVVDDKNSTRIKTETISDEDLHSSHKGNTKILKEAEFKKKMLENSKTTEESDEVIKNHKYYNGNQATKRTKDYDNFKPDTTTWQDDDNCSDSGEERDAEKSRNFGEAKDHTVNQKLTTTTKAIDVDDDLEHKRKHFVKSEENRSVKSVRVQDTASLKSKTEPHDNPNYYQRRNVTNANFERNGDTSQTKSNKDTEFLYERHPRISGNSKEMYNESCKGNMPPLKTKIKSTNGSENNEFLSKFSAPNKFKQDTKYTNNTSNPTRETGFIQSNRFGTSPTSKYDYQKTYMTERKPPLEFSTVNRTPGSEKRFSDDLEKTKYNSLNSRGLETTTDQYKYKPRALSSQQLHEVDLLSLGPGETLRIKCGENATSTKACMCGKFNEKESCNQKAKPVSSKCNLKCSFHEDSHKKKCKKKQKTSQCMENLKRRKKKCPSPNKKKNNLCQCKKSSSKHSQRTPSTTSQQQCCSSRIMDQSPKRSHDNSCDTNHQPPCFPREIAQPPRRPQTSSSTYQSPCCSNKETKPSTCSYGTPSATYRPQYYPKEIAKPSKFSQDPPSDTYRSPCCPKEVAKPCTFSQNTPSVTFRSQCYPKQPTTPSSSTNGKCRVEISTTNCPQFGRRPLKDNPWFSERDEKRKERVYNYRSRSSARLERLLNQSKKAKQMIEMNCNKQVECKTAMKTAACNCSDRLLQLVMSESAECRKLLLPRIKSGEDKNEELTEQESRTQDIEISASSEQNQQTSESENDRSTVEVTVTYGDDLDQDINQDSSNECFVDAPVYCEECTGNMQNQCTDEEQEYCDDYDDYCCENELDDIQEDTCKIKQIFKPKPKKLVPRNCKFESFKVSDEDQATFWCRNCEMLVRPFIVNNKKMYPTACIKYLFSGCLPQMNIKDTLFMCPCCNDYVINMKSSCYFVSKTF